MKFNPVHEFVLSTVFSVAVLLFIMFIPFSPVRVITGLPLVLFLPGFSLMAVLYPRKSDIDSIERFSFSIGLSLAFIACLGLVLTTMPNGLQILPFTILTVIFIIAMSGVAWYRRHRLGETETASVTFGIAEKWRKQNVGDKILSVLLASAILGAVGVVTYAIAGPKMMGEITEFYLFGKHGMAADYPQTLRIGQEGQVTVTVVNQERQPVEYRVLIEQDSGSAWINGESVSSFNISLEHQEKWSENVTFSFAVAGEGQKIEFNLYREEDTEPYLSTYLKIEVNE
ncbi:MAG: DUF1616 domain-containing protein [Dehalococcoidales bacterium]|nr:DUF1616 domain-containing protein [Dehalococcoidales bacterium]